MHRPFQVINAEGNNCNAWFHEIVLSLGGNMTARLIEAKRFGSAVSSAADRTLQLIERPPLLTHITQVCGSCTIKNLVNAKLRHRLA